VLKFFFTRKLVILQEPQLLNIISEQIIKDDYSSLNKDHIDLLLRLFNFENNPIYLQLLSAEILITKNIDYYSYAIAKIPVIGGKIVFVNAINSLISLLIDPVRNLGINNNLIWSHNEAFIKKQRFNIAIELSNGLKEEFKKSIIKKTNKHNFSITLVVRQVSHQWQFLLIYKQVMKSLCPVIPMLVQLMHSYFAELK